MAIGALTSAFKSTVGSVVHAGSSVAHTVASVATGAAKDVSKVATGAASSVAKGASDTVHLSEELMENPKSTLTSWGQSFLMAVTPNPPAYEKLNAQDKASIAKGEQAGGGKTVPMQSIFNSGGRHAEPINIDVLGSKQQLQKDLESQGWKMGYTQGLQKPDILGDITSGNLANLIPFSDQKAKNNAGQTVNPSFVMAKDSSGLTRHHLRVYDLGQEDGQTEWGIASSRDNHPDLADNNGSLEINHHSDPHVDGERDTVLHDLMTSEREQGQTPDLTVYNGKPVDAKVKPGPDGGSDVNHGEYYSDLKLFQLNLN